MWLIPYFNGFRSPAAGRGSAAAKLDHAEERMLAGHEGHRIDLPGMARSELSAAYKRGPQGPVINPTAEFR